MTWRGDRIRSAESNNQRCIVITAAAQAVIQDSQLAVTGLIRVIKVKARARAQRRHAAAVVARHAQMRRPDQNHHFSFTRTGSASVVIVAAATFTFSLGEATIIAKETFINNHVTATRCPRGHNVLCHVLNHDNGLALLRMLAINLSHNVRVAQLMWISVGNLGAGSRREAIRHALGTIVKGLAKGFVDANSVSGIVLVDVPAEPRAGEKARSSAVDVDRGCVAINKLIVIGKILWKIKVFKRTRVASFNAFLDEAKYLSWDVVK